MSLIMVLAHNRAADMALGHLFLFLILLPPTALLGSFVYSTLSKRRAELRVPEALLFDAELKPVTTSDNVTVLVDVLVTAEIFDPRTYAAHCRHNIDEGVISTCQTTESQLENFFRSLDLESCLTEQDELSRSIINDLNKVMSKQGTTVTQVQLKSIRQGQDDHSAVVRRGCEVTARERLLPVTNMPALAVIFFMLFLISTLYFGLLFLGYKLKP
ncbi:MAG: SPFH domain-containing protein [Proteobacteria bacterium]|nr:SPFH domain-containing protein [Pseudomonadota bacterium]